MFHGLTLWWGKMNLISQIFLVGSLGNIQGQPNSSRSAISLEMKRTRVDITVKKPF